MNKTITIPRAILGCIGDTINRTPDAKYKHALEQVLILMKRSEI